MNSKLLASIFFFLIASIQLTAATTYTLTTSGSWNTATNWTPNGVPGSVATDIAVIASGTVSLAADVNLAALVVSSTGSVTPTVIDMTTNNYTITASDSAIVNGTASSSDVLFKYGQLKIDGPKMSISYASFGTSFNDSTSFYATNLSTGIETMHSIFYGTYNITIGDIVAPGFTFSLVQSGGNTYNGNYVFTENDQHVGPPVSNIALNLFECSIFRGKATYNKLGVCVTSNISKNGVGVFDSLVTVNNYSSSTNGMNFYTYNNGTTYFNDTVIVNNFSNTLPTNSGFWTSYMGSEINFNDHVIVNMQIGALVFFSISHIPGTGLGGPINFNGGDIILNCSSLGASANFAGIKLYNNSSIITPTQFLGTQLLIQGSEQIGSKPHNLNLSSNSKLDIANSIFNESFAASCGYFRILSCTYNSDLDINSVGNSSNSITVGTNNFLGVTKFTNNGGQPFTLAGGTDNYFDDLILEGSGVINPNNSGIGNYYKDVIINTTGGPVLFGANTSGNRRAVFTGTNAQSIKGSNTDVAFRNLVLNKSVTSNHLSLDIPISVTTNLSVASGVLDLNDQMLTLTSSTVAVVGGSSSAFIVCENTDNIDGKIVWNVKNMVTSPLTFPVGYQDLSGDYYTPITVSVIQTGSEISAGSGNIVISSYHTDESASPDNNLPYPTSPYSVTQLDRYAINNSTKVVDRFWLIDTTGYTIGPGINLALYYSDNEIGGSNLINENQLKAQLWDNTSQLWSPSVGAVTSGTNKVDISGLNNYGIWVLVDTAKKLECPLGPNLLADDQSVCLGLPISILTSDFPNNVATDYFWSPSAFLSATTGSVVNFSAPMEGTYSVSVIGINSVDMCTDTVINVIDILPLPLVSLSADASVCPGQVSTFTTVDQGTGYSYSWLPDDGLSNSNMPATDVVLDTPGVHEYTLTVSDGNNCVSTGTTLLLVYSPPSLAASDNINLCQSDVTTLSASGSGIDYTWMPDTDLSSSSGNLVSYTAKAVGSSTVSVTSSDINGCSSVAIVHISTVAGVTANAGLDTAICLGANIQLSGEGAMGGTYSWSPTNDLSDPAISNPVSSASNSVTYTLTVSFGSCSNTDSVVITVHQLPTVDIDQGDTTIFKGQSVLLNAGGAEYYSWSPTSFLSLLSDSSSKVTPTQTGSFEYVLIGVDTNMCSASDKVTITVIPPICDSVFVPSAFSPNNDGSNDGLGFGVKLACESEFSNFSFKLYDRWGKLVFETNNVTDKWDGKVNNKILDTNVLFYTIAYNNSSGSKNSQKGNITLIR